MDKNFFSIILIVLGYVLMEVVKSLEKRAKRAKRTSTSEGNRSTVSNEEGVDDVYEANGTEEVTPAMGGGGREELAMMRWGVTNWDALGKKGYRTAVTWLGGELYRMCRSLWVRCLRRREARG